MGGQASYGDEFGKRFGAQRAPVFVTRTLKKSEVAVTYLCQEQPTFELSEQQPIEDAYMASFVMVDNPNYTLWENGKPVATQRVLAGQTTFYDFKDLPIILVNSPLVALHFYFPRAAFDAVADNAGVPRISGLKIPRGFGMDDTVMHGLGTALMPAFQNPERASRLFIDHVTISAAVHLAHAYGDMTVPVLKRGGLAPWQERRAMDLIDANLDGELSQTQLASECGLSPSHFARAFRASTGMAPHQWLLFRRVEKSKALLRNVRLSLADVALVCGFADQSHFTRVFTKFVGISPGLWRRNVLN
ncbi:MAG TPA: AraC family transcriptional regulator [Rhizomicrobium sp.]|nr:AraC family transcriptional regulator [Rhizomicrobium sp.]